MSLHRGILKVIVLATTNNAFWAVDTDRAQAYLIDDRFGFYYGITFNDDQIFVVAQNSVYGKESEAPDRSGRILVFDKDLNLQKELEAPFIMRDAHQLYCFKNKLWIAATWNNFIATFDGQDWDIWQPFGAPKNPDSPDTHHINSILVDDEKIYLAGHGRDGGQAHIFKTDDKSHLVTHDMGQGSHNVWKSGDQIYSMSSNNGELIDLSGNRFPIAPGNFVRGAIILSDRRFFGASSKTDRQSRNSSNSMIVEASLTGKQLRRLGINGYGEMLDIRAPGEVDLAHPSYIGPKISVTILEKKFHAIDIDLNPQLTGKISGFKKWSWWWWQKTGVRALPDF